MIADAGEIDDGATLDTDLCIIGSGPAGLTLAHRLAGTGAHVVLLGGPHLLMAADCPQTALQLEDLGYQPVLVDISEFQRLEGCVTCLSVRVRN